MDTIRRRTTNPQSVDQSGRSAWRLLASHGAPVLAAVGLWWALWGTHTPQVVTTDDAMRHVAWIGIVSLLYLAWQARAVLLQANTGVGHSLIEILVSLLPLFVVGYALIDWTRGANPLSVFQVIAMAQATLAILIDVIFFTWFSLRLNRLTIAHSSVGP